MDALHKITNTFENIKNIIKTKNVSECIAGLKRELHGLSIDLVMLGKESHEMFIRSIAMEGYLTLLSVKTLPCSTAEKHNMLLTTFEKLKPHCLKEEVLFIFLRIQNLLCYYLIQLDQISLCREILESMESLYDKVSNSAPERFLDAENLFTTEPLQSIKRVNPEKIDKVITNNIQMQAFLYNKLNLPEKYVLYNHTVLRRQFDMKEGMPQDWAVRTARLGSYFTYLNQFRNARHHLCAAYHVLRNCHDKSKLIPSEFALQKSEYEMLYLELSHHWVKYGLNLFKQSKKKILSHYFCHSSNGINLWKTIDVVDEHMPQTEKDGEENVKDSGAEKVTGEFVTEKLFTFPSLDLSASEELVPVNFVTKMDEAHKLFVFTHKWLIRAKRYYDFEMQAAQYTSCALQLAELYEHLAFFESNIDNQYSIQKRRAEVLENLNSLLKSCDNMMPVQIDVIRELSQVQLELMALNLRKLWREESQINVLSYENDGESIMNSLESASTKTVTDKTLNFSSKNYYLRKMEAVTKINSRLFRLSGQLGLPSSSNPSFSAVTRN